MRTATLSSSSSLRLAGALLALVFVAACSNGPTAPSGGAMALTATDGAVIQGTVAGGGGAAVSSARPSGARVSASVFTGLQVQVVGTDIVVAVDDNGEFLLSGVPDGTVTLRFFGNGIDVTTELSNVLRNQAIVVQILLDGSSVLIVSEVREGKLTLCHAESASRYHSIAVAESSESAHRAHGDGKIGDPVPGKPNRTFAADCTLLGPEVDIEKATNGRDADNGSGPEIPVGDAVVWTYVVRNIGTVELTEVVVVDDQGVVVDCGGVATLAPGASLTCTGEGVATLGAYVNVGTVTANWSSESGSGAVTDSDVSHYTGVDPDAEDGDGEKVLLCHKTGNGRYLEHEVSEDAEAAHRAHGDAMKGEPVPGMAGKVFSESCVPE